MDIINLTGHLIRVHLAGDPDIVVEIPSILPKAIAKFYHLYIIEGTAGIRLRVDGARPIVENLPEKKEGIIYIISSVAAMAIVANSEYSDRDDLYTPGKKKKREDVIYSCEYLSRVIC